MTTEFSDKELSERAESLVSGSACHICFPSTGKNTWNGSWRVRIQGRDVVLCSGFTCEGGHSSEARTSLVSREPSQWRTRKHTSP